MSSLRASTRLAIATAASLAAALPAAAGSLHARPEIAITICPDHYVVQGRVVEDLDVLDRVVASLGSRTVRLQAGATTAERAQRAAAHRFRALNLELNLLEPREAACGSLAAPRGIAAGTLRGPRPFGIDDEAVDQWWHASMP